MMDNLLIEMCNCEETILAEIACKDFNRRDVAKTYRFAIESSERPNINWKKINAAIVSRWSVYALNWIKRQAHSGKAFLRDDE